MKAWFAIVVSLLLAIPALAGDFWKDKPYQEWTQDQVRTILTDSPWARSYSFKPAGMPVNPGASGDASLAGRDRGEGSAMGGGIPGMSRGSGSEGGLKYLVIWSSATTVRKALARQQLILGKAALEQVEQSLKQPAERYILTLIGPDLSALDAEDPQLAKSKIFLRPKKTKQKVFADQVHFERSPDGKRITAAAFSFPRTAPTGEPIIAVDEKGVEFGCDLKSLSFKVQFDPRAMRIGEAADM